MSWLNGLPNIHFCEICLLGALCHHFFIVFLCGCCGFRSTFQLKISLNGNLFKQKYVSLITRLNKYFSMKVVLMKTHLIDTHLNASFSHWKDTRLTRNSSDSKFIKLNTLKWKFAQMKTHPYENTSNRRF